VLITKHGEVKIVDFGLAKANSQLERSEPGIIKGKFSYLAPEAAMGQEVDARTDIFAVGIILWELLAGQRLFLGDTDFQTVKKVQAAQVPSISQINKKVPKELEKILARALARDPGQRYRTARELGLDLSKFMFQNGVPVSTFDVASLVQGAMKERQRHRPMQASIIDKLIEEALLEFTSLTDDKAGPSAAKPIDTSTISGAFKPPTVSGSTVEVGSWIDEIAVGQKMEADRPSLPLDVTAGNLAALEDDEPLSPHSPPPPSSSKPVMAPATPVSAMLPNPPPLAPSPEKKGGSRLGVVVVLAVVLAAGAAAWFTNLIPHP
jgi:serine/threonine-protein kinase